MPGVTQPLKESQSVSDIKDVEAARKALTFFKVMAFTVGVGLLILVAEMVLKYGFSKNWLDWWPQPHGFIYIVYLAATANLGFKIGLVAGPDGAGHARRRGAVPVVLGRAEGRR